VLERGKARTLDGGGVLPAPHRVVAVPGMPLHHQVFLLWPELVSSRGTTAATTVGVGGGSS
jgi:hypothetical protein